MFSTLFLILSQMIPQKFPSYFSKFSSINALIQPPTVIWFLASRTMKYMFPALLPRTRKLQDDNVAGGPEKLRPAWEG